MFCWDIMWTNITPITSIKRIKSQEPLLCRGGKQELADSRAEVLACKWEGGTLCEYALFLQESPPDSQGRTGLGGGWEQCAWGLGRQCKNLGGGDYQGPQFCYPPHKGLGRGSHSSGIKEDWSQKAPNKGLKYMVAFSPYPFSKRNRVFWKQNKTKQNKTKNSWKWKNVRKKKVLALNHLLVTFLRVFSSSTFQHTF